LQESIFFGVRILLLEEIINQVDLERLYQHSLAIEGIRHFQVNPEKLAETADYIRKELKAYGLQVQEQVFTFDGIPYEFKNVEGILGDEKKPALLITSHYDTVQNSPGANDNGSGVVAMLEVARILAGQKMDDFCLRFVSFTQEETHPVFYSRLFKKRLELGLVDKKDRYLRFHTQQLVKNFLKQFWRFTATGKSYTEGAKLTFEKFKDDLDEREQAYFSYLLELLQELKDPTDWIGTTALVGSTKYVEKAMKEKRDILGVINLETIGYTSSRKHSQLIPSIIFKLFPKYRTNLRQEIGNFIGIISDKQSHALAKFFCQQCKKANIKLPYVNYCLPYNFETLAVKVRDSLRSDHAPFLKYGIPAIMVTDTANFRYPFYHTEADTIDKLDFHFIRKVCQATLVTALQFEKFLSKKAERKTTP